MSWSGAEMRCPKCNKYMPDRCICNGPSIEEKRMTAAPTLEAERAAPGSYLNWWTSIETDIRKSMLVWAHREPARLHALVKQAYEAGQESQMARIKHLTHERDLALRLARTAAPVAEAVALPPLPEPDHSLDGGTLDFYTAEQVRQAQREAVEADRAQRRDGMSTALAEVTDRLGREAAENLSLKMELRALTAKLVRENQQPARSIDTPAFGALLSRYNQGEITEAQLIAYIDGRTDGTARPGAPDPTEAAIERRAKEIYAGFDGAARFPWQNGGNSLMQDKARKMAEREIAAAPSPLPPKEEAK